MWLGKAIYEAWAILSETELVSLQPLGADHATLPHMKAMHVPFHLVYCSLISFRGNWMTDQNV